MEKVAIIGLGISGAGVLLAYHKLLKEEQFPVSIHVYDESTNFGKGLPFSEKHHQALNNSRSHQISFDYENMEDFHEWLEASDKEYRTYAPRGWYGEYNLERTNQLIEQLEAIRHQTKIENIRYIKSTQKWQIIDEKGEIIEYDRVHLCSGVLPVLDIFNLEGRNHYIHRPYPLTNIPDSIKEAKNVAIVGMGLTALDVIKYLLDETEIEKIYTFSRTGLFPSIRGEDNELEFSFLNDENIKKAIDENNGYFSLEAFETLLESELAQYDLSWDSIRHKLTSPGIEGVTLSFENASKLGKAQAIAMQVTNVMTIGWEMMTEVDRKEYLSKYHKLIVNLRNPAPPVSGEQLLDAVMNGRLVILPDVSDITPLDSKGFTLALENPDVLNVEWVINATGMKLTQDSDLSDFTLLNNLINQRLIQIDTAGGLSVNLQTGNVISPRFGEIKTLHAHGMLIEGVVYQNNSTIKIQAFAETLLRRLYNRTKNDELQAFHQHD